MAENKETPPGEEVLSTEEEAFQHQLIALATGNTLISGVNVRQFSLTSGKSILGFLIKELPDSFLLVLPTSLHSSGGEISASLVTSPPLCRFLKGNIMMTTIASDLPLLYYLLSVEEHFSLCPGFFTEKRIAKIKVVIQEMRNRLGGVTLSSPKKEVIPPEILKDNSDMNDFDRMADPPSNRISRTKH